MSLRSVRKPQRTCVGCRKRDDQDLFLRVFRDSEGRVRVYDRGLHQGRSAYVCAVAACIDAALLQDRLARALHASVSPEARNALREELLARLR